MTTTDADPASSENAKCAKNATATRRFTLEFDERPVIRAEAHEIEEAAPSASWDPFESELTIVMPIHLIGEFSDWPDEIWKLISDIGGDTETVCSEMQWAVEEAAKGPA